MERTPAFSQGFGSPEFMLLWIFGWVFAVILIWYLVTRRKDRKLELIHKERLVAMEKGIPLPELPTYEESNRRPADGLWTQIRLNPRWPLGVGSVFIMLGIGTTLALALSAEPYHNRVWSFGLIPIFFGVGLFLHYKLTRKGSD